LQAKEPEYISFIFNRAVKILLVKWHISLKNLIDGWFREIDYLTVSKNPAIRVASGVVMKSAFDV
jgi:hypothetical protein